ncbi:protein PIMREG [Crotalus tigris]|uniref:protein PIMREG n=1 Tax=Crotalus tigris TaxID=88082 RepID=UPI00192F5265|nr:protein PIMREG [Crotalus tigris]
MASVFQTMGSSIGWRSHQILSDSEESPMPDRFRKRSSLNINSVRMSLRKRMPLKEVKMNFDENPTWESLEAKEKSSNLRMLTRTAKNVFGTMSQKMQRSCQAPSRALAASLAKDPRGKSRSSTKPPNLSPRTPCQNKKLASISTPTSSTRIVSPSSKKSGSCQRKKNLPLRRSMRAAALRSPYGSPVSLAVRRQLDCDLELVSTGIRQLKRLSYAFNDIIVQEERDQAILNYYEIMAQNIRTMQLQSGSLAHCFRRQARRVRWTCSSWAENHFR